MAYFVYIVECADKTLYTGSTNDLKKRLISHNFHKNGARYTKSRRPVVLKYSENLETKSDALKRECELKKYSRAEKLKIIKSKKHTKKRTLANIV